MKNQSQNIHYKNTLPPPPPQEIEWWPSKAQGPNQLFNDRDRKGLGPMRPCQLDAGKLVNFMKIISIEE